MIRVSEILREAWRNTMSGASRPIIAMLLLIAVVGSLGCVQIVSTVQVNRDAAHWRDIGASTQIVTLAGKIDGARCEALTETAGIAAAGAVRAGPLVQFAALPSTTFKTFEGTPVLAKVIRLERDGGTGASGIWVSSDLAATLGVTAGAKRQLVTTSGGSLRVGGLYEYPEDGRQPVLAYNAIGEVPAVGTFDACWIEIWPENAKLDALLTLPITNSGTISPDEAPRIEQLNASEGTTFDGPQRQDRMPAWLLVLASVLAGMLLGCALVWTRRLELASSLHAGVQKVSLSLTAATESVLYAVPAAALSLGVALLIALFDNPGSPWPAYLGGAGVVVAGIVATVVATSLATLTVSERRLFRYFKSR